MLCLALLALEAWGLSRLSGDRRRFRDLFAPDAPAQRSADSPLQTRGLAIPAVASLVLLLLAVYPALAVPERTETTPTRDPFVTFPMQIDGWQGRRESIEQIYLDVLQLDDYALTDYVREGEVVNFYAAYYASQRTGASAHSPASCLPGGGWRIQSLERKELSGIRAASGPLAINRVLIQQGSSRQLVYYWFQQRGRTITNEYLVKWYLFWDSLTRSRTDGALVRITTPLRAGEPVDAAEARLFGFTEKVVSRLNRYVPD